jgi:putative DNA primase/helicase
VAAVSCSPPRLRAPGHGTTHDEARVKNLTGGEKIKVRHLYGHPFEFRPTFKLVFISNHQPAIGHLDPAWRRRMHVIPFEFVPEEIDKDLELRLFEQEGGAILQWLIDGAVAYHSRGLDQPQVVRDATADYFDTQDPVGRWMNKFVTITGNPEDRATVSDLKAAYNGWAVMEQYPVYKPAPFGTLLKRKFQGMSRVSYYRTEADRGYRGITLSTDTTGGLV